MTDDIRSPGSPTDDLAPSLAGAPATAEGRPTSRTRTFLHPNIPALLSVTNILWVTFFLGLTAATRCANYRNVFVTSEAGAIEQVYFVDGDCYSRMTRVREIMQGWGMIHYPSVGELADRDAAAHDGAVRLPDRGNRAVAEAFQRSNISIMAGAIVSPILGVLTTAFLALWARELNQRYRKLMLLLASLSPILVHGTALGRPDHQSLQMLLAAVGIGAELIMARAPCVSWGIVSGVAWGLAIWVSLYEPLVLMRGDLCDEVDFLPAEPVREGAAVGAGDVHGQSWGWPICWRGSTW